MKRVGKLALFIILWLVRAVYAGLSIVLMIPVLILYVFFILAMLALTWIEERE